MSNFTNPYDIDIIYTYYFKSGASDMNNIEISTKCGKIVGIKADGYTEFRSIKYADAKRWEYPKQITEWNGVYDATYFKDASFQRRSFEEDSVCNAFYHKEFRRGLSFTYSEDCQYLNIWAPENAENCPVLVYIHGGSFTGGSTDEGHLNGSEFAKNGIILVSMNYRLGPYGFCSHPDLKNDERLCGNYGLYDQYIAIKWIKENISAFGGNSDKITLAGQSAGAMSVDIQISNPMCKGWFSGAYMMSGAAMQRGLLKPLKPEKTRDFWETVIKNAGVNTIEELKKADEKTLYYAWYDACNGSSFTMPYTFPVYDGKLLCENSFKMNSLPDIPYVLGVTITDMIPIVLKGIIKKWVKSASKNKNKCYAYLFARKLPGDDKGAWHACDLLYAFKTLDFNWRPFEESDYKIADEMHKSLCAFAKNGDPNCDAIPKWESGSKKIMVFDENTGMSDWKTAELIKNTFANGGSI